MQKYPAKGADLDRIPGGENVVDEITEILGGYGQKLQNMEYRRGTLKRRAPFTAKSDLDFTAEADFGDGAETPGEFAGGLEYIDLTDTARVLHAHTNGTIKEFVNASSSVNRVSGLTVGRRIRMAQMLGAAFAVNGENDSRRGDEDSWRVAGSPTPAGTLSLGAASAGAITGTHLWMVTACIDVSGTVILESDHSNYVEATLASEQQALSWAASADSRVNWYRLYRTKNGLGSPWHLVTEGNITSYTDNTLDADLPEQLAKPLGQNGTMPIGEIIAVAGGRLIVGRLKASNGDLAQKQIAMSIVATNRYEMEYFPDDGLHRFALPGVGPVMAVIPYGVKDEDSNAKDVFLAQRTSCYILRGSNPYGVLEPISAQVGVRNPEAITQWGPFLFWISNRGLEFLGPTGEPQLISQYVNAYFFGGGPLNLAGVAGDQYLTLSIDQNRLLITLRDDSAKVWGNRCLVMDLERFNPYAPEAWKSAHFTNWTGPGFAFFVITRDAGCILFDNQNKRLLERGTGYRDSIAGTLTTIDARIWTRALFIEASSVYKVLRQMNVLQLSEQDTTLDVEADFDFRSENSKAIPRFATGIDWDKEWDKSWGSSSVFLSTVYFKRALRGRIFQLKFTNNTSTLEFIWIGFTIFYTAVIQRRMIKR